MTEKERMFRITCEDIIPILHDYHIPSKIKNFCELQRYAYERNDSNSREVRLIVKVELVNATSLVIRFKNEHDVTLELIEKQCRFADTLKKNGIPTPNQYKSNGRYANWYTINGYDVIVTIEQFVENEVKVVDTIIARKTGELLAKTHNVAEQNQIHIQNNVLFNPFCPNDLFSFDDFKTLAPVLQGEDKLLFDRISSKYHIYMKILAPLRAYPRYAVQGDISDCNLYLTAEENVGIFDFNRSGDNILFCDAVMQAVFEARLMDYPENSDSNFEDKILDAFLEGYRSVRSFSEKEQEWYPYLLAIINAFWRSDIRWNEDSLLNAQKAGDQNRVHQWLETIWKHLRA